MTEAQYGASQDADGSATSFIGEWIEKALPSADTLEGMRNPFGKGVTFLGVALYIGLFSISLSLGLSGLMMEAPPGPRGVREDEVKGSPGGDSEDSPREGHDGKTGSASDLTEPLDLEITPLTLTIEASAEWFEIDQVRALLNRTGIKIRLKEVSTSKGGLIVLAGGTSNKWKREIFTKDQLLSDLTDLAEILELSKMEGESSAGKARCIASSITQVQNAAAQVAPLGEGPWGHLSEQWAIRNALAEKKKVVVYFWATWCGPCVAEMPELEILAKRFASKATFVGISDDIRTRETLAQTRLRLRDFVVPFGGLRFHYIQRDQQIMKEFFGRENPPVPGFALLDAEGRIFATFFGSLAAEGNESNYRLLLRFLQGAGV